MSSVDATQFTNMFNMLQNLMVQNGMKPVEMPKTGPKAVIDPFDFNVSNFIEHIKASLHAGNLRYENLVEYIARVVNQYDSQAKFNKLMESGFVHELNHAIDGAIIRVVMDNPDIAQFRPAAQDEDADFVSDGEHTYMIESQGESPVFASKTSIIHPSKIEVPAPKTTIKEVIKRESIVTKQETAPKVQSAPAPKQETVPVKVQSAPAPKQETPTSEVKDDSPKSVGIVTLKPLPKGPASYSAVFADMVKPADLPMSDQLIQRKQLEAQRSALEKQETSQAKATRIVTERVKEGSGQYLIQSVLHMFLNIDNKRDTYASDAWYWRMTGAGLVKCPLLANGNVPGWYQLTEDELADYVVCNKAEENPFVVKKHDIVITCNRRKSVFHMLHWETGKWSHFEYLENTDESDSRILVERISTKRLHEIFVERR